MIDKYTEQEKKYTEKDAYFDYGVLWAIHEIYALKENSDKLFDGVKIMLKKIIYYVRQFLNLVCISNGISCLIGAFGSTVTKEMQFVIGGIGVVSFVYGANKIIELYYDCHATKTIKEMKKTIVDMMNNGKSSAEIFEALVDDKYIYDEESGKRTFEHYEG